MTFPGYARRDTFVDDRERERQAERVGESAEDLGVRVYEYCGMPNVSGEAVVSRRLHRFVRPSL